MALNLSFGRAEATVHDVAIVGGGPAGATAAIYAARAGLKTVVLDKSVAAGALGITGQIANYPGVSEVLTGAELLGRMREQAMGFGAEFVQAQVSTSDLGREPKELYTSAGTYLARTVIVATGKLGRKHKAPGEEEYLGRGVSYCATCDAAFFRGRTVAVVGASEHAVEEALFTAQLAAAVKVLAPGDKLTAPPDQLAALVEHPRVEVLYRRPLRAVVASADGSSVAGVRVAGPEGEVVIPADGVFIYLAGNAPILDFVGGAELQLTGDGCVAAGPDRSTSIPGVFAAGDVLCSFIQQAVVAAADGAIAAMAAERYLRGRKRVRSDWG